MTRSPWWYRRRAYIIGAIFFLGFFLGNLAIWHQPQPMAILLGERWGDAGVEAALWLGIAFVVAAWLVRVWGTAYLRLDVVFAADVRHERFIVAGPFRYVRNPLYLGNDLMALGFGLYAPPMGFAIIVLGNVIFGMMLAGEEARLLELRFGGAYAAYRRAVPAFVPRLTPVAMTDTSGAVPSFRRALLVESFVLGFALALVPIALFGQAGVPAAAVVYVASLVAFAAVSRLMRR